MLVEVYALEDDSCRLKRTLSALVPVWAQILGNRIGERLRFRLVEMCREVEMHGQDYRQSSVREDQVSAPQRGKGSDVGERRALTLKAGQGMAEREIRTLDSLAGMPVFKTGDINHSAISPTILSLRGFARRFPTTESRKMGRPAFFALLPLCFKSAPSYAHTR